MTTAVISQFTLHAKTGTSFSIRAAHPEHAEQLYQHFVAACASATGTETGEFGANMAVDLVNNGPVTLWLDTKHKE